MEMNNHIEKDIQSFIANINFGFWIDLLSAITTEKFYVIDVVGSRICYIKADNSFLCGYSAEDAMKSGYDFYRKIIHPDDLPLWEKIRIVIFAYLDGSKEKRDEVDYFSCTFRLQRQYSFISHPLPQMIYHRIIPVYIDKVLRYLLCSVKSSTVKEAGHLCMYSKCRSIYEEYNFISRRWKRKSIEPLTERESAILMLAEQGKKANEIADLMCKGFHAIRNQIKPLFEKLNVNSMQEAVELSSYYRMIHPKKAIKLMSVEEDHAKTTRNYLTNEIKHRIENSINAGNSIRSTAKNEGFSEGAIRYWIKKGMINVF